MSLQDDLTSVQRRLDDLVRSVGLLEQHVGNSLDMRRVRADADHLRESLTLLRETARGAGPPGPVEMVIVPDTPYDPGLWSDCEDEGLGSAHGHAP
ncbi:hypothetical protein QMK19_23805 [Streptomyces sp. H10-C2]|uniref:hypothetical protein n=1 Tax=unclassified Streptomyces TaxID=2593676 RepID=UPI0024B957AE|nr:MULTISPECIES: hypothetical protein [unclassified Streptomyces]MDJ0342687.1 hypothetical protein [Streptomyces sp. PH10-H1]MDJ0372604.1 hypothetical protein [Streptomyces sp. H10-C2]